MAITSTLIFLLMMRFYYNRGMTSKGKLHETAHTDLNELLLDGLCSLQLCLNHFDELNCSIFCPDVAKTSFLKELQGRKG